MVLSKLLRFLPDAVAAMGRSKDRSTKVGAVAIDDNYCLKGSGYNHFRGLTQSGIDDLHAGIAQGSCDDFGATVVAIQAHFGD